MRVTIILNLRGKMWHEHIEVVRISLLDKTLEIV